MEQNDVYIYYIPSCQSHRSQTENPPFPLLTLNRKRHSRREAQPNRHRYQPQRNAEPFNRRRCRTFGDFSSKDV